MTDFRDRTMSPERATLLGIPLATGLAAAILYLHHLLWGGNPLLGWFTATHPVALLAIFVLAVPLHEGLHAVGWHLASPSPRPAIKFGMNWRALMPFAHAMAPLTVRAYRLGGLAPGILMGLLPSAVGITTGSVSLSAWGAIFLAFAAGDFLVLASLWGVPSDALVQDHPSRVGCEVVGPIVQAA